MLTCLENSNFTNALKIIATQSRRSDLSPVLLSDVHRNLGRLTSYEYVKHFSLDSIEIAHVQGIRKGFGISPDDFTLILTMMRSGLFIAEGFREIIDNHCRRDFIYQHTDVNSIFQNYDCVRVHIALIDSVINTGNSITKMLDSIPKCKSLTVICQVMFKEFAESDLVQCSDIHFITCRISENYYVGRGKTDTGDRLLGHYPEFE